MMERFEVDLKEIYSKFLVLGLVFIYLGIENICLLLIKVLMSLVLLFNDFYFF